MAKPVKTVDEYIAQFDSSVSKSLAIIRRTIKSAAPKAEEIISYRIPLYKCNGHLVAFMAAKNHCSLITMSQPIIKSLNADLRDFKVSGTTIHFRYEYSIPGALIKKIVKARIKENEEKASKSENKKRK